MEIVNTLSRYEFNSCKSNQTGALSMYLNNPITFSGGEFLFPQNGDAGVKPARVIRDRELLLLTGNAHLWIITMYIISSM